MKTIVPAALLACAALCGCADDQYQKMRDPYSVGGPVPAMDDSRKVNEQDCSKDVDLSKGNIRCK